MGYRDQSLLLFKRCLLPFLIFHFFRVKLKLIYSNFLGAIAEYPANFEWHKFIAPVVLQ